jgi:hypothetical protein
MNNKNLETRENFKLVLLSFCSIAILSVDLYFQPSLFSLLKIISLLIIFTGIVLKLHQQSQTAADMLSLGYSTVFLVYLIDTIISYRSYQPSFLAYSSLKLLVFAYGIICCQKNYIPTNIDSNNRNKEAFLSFKLPQKAWQSIITITVSLLLLLLLFGTYPFVSCVATNGEYTSSGLLDAEFCLYKFEDGGKACKSSDECIGSCVIYDDMAVSSTIPTTGVCESDSYPYGCKGYVENGKSFGIVCTD